MSSNVAVFVYVSFACALLTAVWHFTRKRRRWAALIDEIPGPKGLPLLGITWQLLTSREQGSRVTRELAEPFAKKYPLVRAWLGPLPIVTLLKAEAAKALLSSSRHIQKSPFYRFLHNWIGLGLLTSTGAKWQHRRKMITPSFHFRILENFLLVMNEQADILVKLLAHKTNCGQFDIYPFITRCTLDIICETAMGQGVNAQMNADSEYVNAVNSLSQVVRQRVVRPWYSIDWLYNLSSYGRLERKSIQVVHQFTHKIIKLKRRKLEQRSGQLEHEREVVADDVLGLKRRVALLDMLLNSSADGQALTDEDIREEVDTFMFEGHDTTSVGISWAIYCIGQHPHIQQKIYDELTNVFGENERGATSEDLHNLKYLECVIKESMRLFPPVPGYGRYLTEPINICGYEVPAGVTVLVANLFIHRDPAHYPDPEKFDPDRFLPENSRDRDPFAYLPFSAGLRNCIGQKFALMEEKVVLSRILSRFKVSSVHEPDILSNIASELVLRPIRGIHVQLEPRTLK